VGYQDQIEIESVDWRVQIPANRGNEPGQAVQPKFEEVTLDKHVDSSTCTLLKWAKTRKRSQTKDAIKQMAITYVDMVLDKDGTNHAVPVVEFMLHSCYIESLALKVGSGGKGSVAMKETLVVSYERIDLVYHPAGDDRLKRGAATTFHGQAAGKVD
jgi:type VI protein secretion system component Hcp